MNPILPFIIESDMSLLVEKSTDFGQDIAQSFVRLAEKIDNNGQKRDCYGIVTKENESIKYYAGFTEIEQGESDKKSLPKFILPKGNYHSILIEDWNKNILHIGPTFDQILRSGLVDTSSPCIEYYRTESELVCMVKSI